MSQSDSATATDSPALGCRENWWGETDDPDHTNTTSTATASIDERLGREDTGVEGTDRDDWLAHKLLKEASKLVCPECGGWAVDSRNPGDADFSLSEPQHYVGRSRVEVAEGVVIDLHADHRRSRHCRLCGRVGGGPIADLPTPRFLDVVDGVIEVANLPPRLAADVRQSARERKQRGLCDEDNLGQLLRDLRYGPTTATA